MRKPLPDTLPVSFLKFAVAQLGELREPKHAAYIGILSYLMFNFSATKHWETVDHTPGHQLKEQSFNIDG